MSLKLGDAMKRRAHVSTFFKIVQCQSIAQVHQSIAWNKKLKFYTVSIDFTNGSIDYMLKHFEKNSKYKIFMMHQIKFSTNASKII